LFDQKFRIVIKILFFVFYGLSSIIYIYWLYIKFFLSAVCSLSNSTSVFLKLSLLTFALEIKRHVLQHGILQVFLRELDWKLIIIIEFNLLLKIRVAEDFW